MEEASSVNVHASGVRKKCQIYAVHGRITDMRIKWKQMDCHVGSISRPPTCELGQALRLVTARTRFLYLIFPQVNSLANGHI